MNGDGVRDFIVGATHYNTMTGYVRVYSGANCALLKQTYGEYQYGYYGSVVAKTGDLNGDGTADYMTAAPRDVGGHVYNYSGKTHALIWKASGTLTGGRMGEALASIGDVNGDGKDDILTGAPGVDNGSATDAGAAYILSGASGAVLATLLGNAAYAEFGASVGCPGDVDGDGMKDFAVGEPRAAPGGRLNAGMVHVFSGATYAPLYQCEGMTAVDLLGSALAAAGDANGDGRPDFVAGAPGSTAGGAISTGSAFVFSGARLPLHAALPVLPAAGGGQVAFELDAGSANAGRPYYLLGSMSGTSPGTPLGSTVLPLNYDAFMNLTLIFANTPVFASFFGLLDAQGRATATLDSLGPISPAAVGVQMHFAAVLDWPLDYATNAHPVEIMP
ncbi:MAG: VCBS repeat-containing protein [Planctomycetes bacterium]|nr:VCBS repeat-containing protein [Planctomycetota bacterium]